MVSTETHIQVTLYSLSRLYLWLYVYVYKHIHVKIINAKAWFERLLRIYGRALEGKGVWKNDVIIFMISKVKETIIIIINQCDQQQAKKKLFSPERKISNGKCFSWTSQHFANTFEQFWHGEKQYVIAGGGKEKSIRKNVCGYDQ